VYSKAGLMKLNLNTSNLGAHSMVKTDGGGGTINVRSITMDDYFCNSSMSIDFIKMDIEGAEEFAIMGAEKVLSQNPNIVIIMEFMPQAVTILRKMRSLGFRVFVIEHGSGFTKEHVNDSSIIEYIESEGHGLVNILYTNKYSKFADGTAFTGFMGA
jgi:predicted Fe-Mo cluster-binding NifX family protein